MEDNTENSEPMGRQEAIARDEVDHPDLHEVVLVLPSGCRRTDRDREGL